MKNQPGTMKNHENQTGAMKNQPGTMNNYENRPGTMKNKPLTIKPWKQTCNHDKTNLEPCKTMKTILEPWKTNLEPWKTMKTHPEPWKTNLEQNLEPWNRPHGHSLRKWSFFVTNRQTNRTFLLYIDARKTPNSEFSKVTLSVQYLNIFYVSHFGHTPFSPGYMAV